MSYLNGWLRRKTVEEVDNWSRSTDFVYYREKQEILKEIYEVLMIYKCLDFWFFIIIFKKLFLLFFVYKLEMKNKY